MESKQVNSNCPEFGYELLSAIPYAYNLYLKGELKETISGFDTKCLYFFSPKHTENNCKRSWDNMEKLWKIKFPNINIHQSQLDWNLFTPPPFKEFYKNKSINFEKETIVIFNRYNNEWGGPPINYLDLDTLDKLFKMLSDKYQVVYVNLNKGDKYFDGANPMQLNDDTILKKYPKVYSLYDVMDMYPNVSLNEIQLRLFVNCSKYISSNGGQLILSAYFGGENIIFSKKCKELEPNVNSFYKWYHKLGGGVFQHVNNYSDLIELVRQKWVLKKPLINILVRTSGRPNYFKYCMNSIYEQTYKNWNIIIGTDDKQSLKYTQSAKGRDVSYDYSKTEIPHPPKNENYGINFIYNLYLNDLQKQVNSGYIIYLDDDDRLGDKNSLTTLVNNINGDDDFVMWRVGFPNRLVPSDENFGNRPKLRDVSGIGFSFNFKHKTSWEPYKRGDFRVADELYDKIPNKVYIDSVITKLQRQVEDGFGKKDDLPNEMLKNVGLSTQESKIVILSTLWNATKQIPQFISSIKSQTYKNFKVIIVDDNSSDGSLLMLTKLTFGDDRFTIIRNETQKFKTQNFYEVIHNQNLINDDNIIIELDGDDAFYGNNVVEKVNNHFKTPNLWIAGYRWIDNKGQKSPFKFSPNADNPRSQVWSYSAMRVFKAFLFRNIKQSDLMFGGDFVRAANDVAYGMPMLEMSGKEHFRSFNDTTYLYNWHDKNTHSKTSSVRDTSLQKRTEKYIYSLTRYQKLILNDVVTLKNNVTVIPKTKNIENRDKINKIKNLIPVTQQPERVIEKAVEKQEVIKIVNLIPKITNNNNIRKITSQILSKPKEDNDNRPSVINETKVKVTEQIQNNQTKNTPRFNFDTPIVKPQDKVEIDKKRQEFENVLLYTPNGKKQIKPIPPKNIGIRI